MCSQNENTYTTCFGRRIIVSMLIIRVAGGLGNQMQQYAMYRKLKSLGKEVKLDLSWFDVENQEGQLAPRKCELKYFDGVDFEECTDAERAYFTKRNILTKALNKVFPATCKIFEETEMFHPEIYSFKDKYLEGYFLCNKYYDDILPFIQNEIVFPKHSDSKIQKRNEELMERMDGWHTASIHLRRGDYITEPQNEALFGNIATDAYYDAAIRYVLDKDYQTHFYIFSNDPEYAREHYSDESRYTIVTGNDGDNSLLDMELMSHCRYNICANSTFSFWGARLNKRSDKEIIRTFKMRNNQEVTAREMTDYWKDWILIDEKGNRIF